MNISNAWAIKITRENGQWKASASRPITRFVNGKKKPDRAMCVTLSHEDMGECIAELEKHVMFLEAV